MQEGRIRESDSPKLNSVRASVRSARVQDLRSVPSRSARFFCYIENLPPFSFEELLPKRPKEERKDFAKKEGGSVNKIMERIRWNRLRAVSRRALSGVLALAVALPMTTSAFAASGSLAVGSIWPLQATHYDGNGAPFVPGSVADINDSADFPNVEIESNFVRDEFGFLTGYMELGLRVQTTAGKHFKSLKVNVEYDTKLLTPVDWTVDANEIPLSSTSTNADPTHSYDYYSEQLPIEVWPEISGGSAQSGWPDNPISNTANGVTTVLVSNGVADNSRALLYLEAHSNKSGDYDKVVLSEMTTLAVVRFKVSEDLMEHLTLAEDAAGEKTYVCYDDTVVTNVTQLQNEMANASTSVTVDELVCFAEDGDIQITNDFGEMMLEYQGGDAVFGNGSYYYSDEYYYTDITAEDTVTEEINGHTYTMKKLKTTAQLPYPAVDVTKADGTDGKYSYLTNLIYNPAKPNGEVGENLHINFTVTSKRSFVDNKDMLGNMTTIVYVDWDNTLLGTQIVPKNTDIRGLVSDHVAENFIYHDADDSTYGVNDINDPSQTSDPEATVKSLSRADNYRGKYPSTPSPDGTTDSTTVDDKANLPNGSEYPLSNKLDYVFFKRPMTHPNEPDYNDAKYAGTNASNSGKNHPQYIIDMEEWAKSKDWIQKTTTGGSGSTGIGAYYDVEHPYAYGWAKCTVDNYEDVWTTLGTTGELSDYDKDSDGNGTAKFSDADSNFQIADLEKGLTEDTVFLKAIYEPGEDLLSDSGINYRMIKEPYYNKFNSEDASSGGSYSADVTFERASTQIGNLVQGVARLREPVVRQDTTVDYRWKELPDYPTLNHALSNALDAAAYGSKAESTFTRIDVENMDEITFTMALSARFNKVDYYIMETYGKNFVAGVGKTDIDNTRSGKVDLTVTATEIATVDNYKYYVDGESLVDGYYAATLYEDREGTRGYVLYGTLNKIMQVATQYNAGEVTQLEFENNTTEGSLLDANLYMETKKVPNTDAEWATMHQKILDAAQKAKDYHDAGDDSYWDTEHDCAQLTYHQLQGFILDGTFHNEDPFAALTWCHLHDACVAQNSGIPSDWASLVDAAKNTPDKIDALNMTNVEKMAHLRKDAAGAAFASVADFKTAFIAAVNAGNTTWNTVQDYIIRGTQTDADTYAQNHYWWYDGATSSTIGSWSDLLVAAGEAFDDTDNIKAPGETTAVVRPAKLDQLETAFNANQTAGDTAYNDAIAAGSSAAIAKIIAANATDAAWVKATENLCADKNGAKFTDFATFKSALIGALTSAKTAGVTDPDWYQIQYAILNPTEPFPTVKYGDPGYETEMDTYWWHNGGKKIVDLETLLQAARDANNGNTSALDSFTETDLYSFPDFHFRSEYKGTKYTSATINDFKTALKNYVADPNSYDTWDQLQYYIIATSTGATCDLSTVVVDLNEKKAYFWWKNGGEGSAETFTTTTKGKIDDLIRAAYRSKITGDAKAWDNLTETIIKDYRLIKTEDSSTSFNDFPKFETADLGTAKTLLETFVVNAIAQAGQSAEPMPDLPTATWYQLQYALLNNGDYKPTTDADMPDSSVYWWLMSDSNVNPQSEFDTLLKNAYKVYDGSMTANDFKDTITPELLSLLGFKPNATTSYTASNISTAKTRLSNLKTKASAYISAADQKINLTWYQVQWYLKSNNILAPAAAQTQCTNNGFVAPSWVTAGASLFGMSLAATNLEPVVNTTTSADGSVETEEITEYIYNEETGLNDTRITRTETTREIKGDTVTVTKKTTVYYLTVDLRTFAASMKILSEKVEVTKERVQDPVYDNAPDTEVTLPGEEDDTVYTVHPDTDVVEPDEDQDTDYDIGQDADEVEPDKDRDTVYDIEQDTDVVDPDEEETEKPAESTDKPVEKDETTDVTSPPQDTDTEDTDAGDTYTIEPDTTPVGSAPEPEEQEGDNTVSFIFDSQGVITLAYKFFAASAVTETAKTGVSSLKCTSRKADSMFPLPPDLSLHRGYRWGNVDTGQRYASEITRIASVFGEKKTGGSFL